MKLLISEKPSVAMAISKVLGAKSRKDGYMEGSEYLISWCVGHLVELAPADAYDARYSKWNQEDLPIIPQDWQYQVLPATKKQFQVLSTLMQDKRVDGLICATDAGREGELIFRLVYNLFGCAKPVQRLWISSMEESAIRKGMENLQNDSAFDNLYAAALCRAKADWLIGINATRLFSVLHNRTLNVGRVMTPTLALLVERETAIAGFKKEKFYTVDLAFPEFHADSERFSSKTDAEKLRTACVGKPVTVQKVETLEKKDYPPKLYDLTTLQREANRLFSYTAQQTLDYLQSLYEKHLLTYPRTDSRYLTDEMGAELPALCKSVADLLPFARDRPLTVDVGRVLDSKKVSDHHAIIPTTEAGNADLDTLPSGERNIFNMVAVRLLCAVGEPHIYLDTAVTLECGGVLFTASGTTEVSEGWKALEKAFQTARKKKRDSPVVPLPALAEHDRLMSETVSVREGTTKPPSRYTEDTLLSAMERASAEDFAKIEDLERAGLGTPATRAGIIEKLIKAGFAEREKKQLVPTDKGVELVHAMPQALKSAELTAQWEEKLSEVQRGERSPKDFMDGIALMLQELVKAYQDVQIEASRNDSRPVVGVCPRCGKNVVEGKKSFFCQGYFDKPSCGFALWKNDRFFTAKRKEMDKKVAATLLKNGRIHMKNLFSEKRGVYYDATIVMDDDGGKFVHFKLEFDQHSDKDRKKTS